MCSKRGRNLLNTHRLSHASFWCLNNKKNIVWSWRRIILSVFLLSFCCFFLRTAIIVHQESVCATFGSGLSSACVVDVGDQKTSLCCVEDGVSQRNSRCADVSIKTQYTVITLACIMHLKKKKISHISFCCLDFAECLWRTAAPMWRALSTGFCRGRVSPIENVNCPTGWTVSCCSIWRKPSATWTKCVFVSSFIWYFADLVLLVPHYSSQLKGEST